MATILNNQAASAQSTVRIVNPYIYVPLPDDSGPVSNGVMYFGEPQTDPELEQYQRRVYALQEDGSAIPLQQPIALGAGGVPYYNNSPVVLAIDGSYSWKVLSANGEVIYNYPNVTHASLSSTGQAGVIEDVVTLSSTQSSVTFPRADISMSTIDVLGPNTDDGNLLRDTDYTVTNGSTGTIFLISTFPDGTKIRARQNVFSSQDESGASGFVYTFGTVADAAIADIPLDSTVTIMGGAFYKDGLGFDRYAVVPGGTGPNDGIIYINMTNGNQLQAIDTRARFQTYAESRSTVTVSSGVLTLDLNKGTAFTVTLTESVSNINFVNALSNSASSVTLNVKQDGTGGRGMAFSGLKAAGGSPPTLTTTANAESKLVFSTTDGSSWEVFLAADDMQVVP